MYSGVSRGAQVTGIAVMALSLTWISAILRIYVRVGILKFLGRDDWLMFAAMVLRIHVLLKIVADSAGIPDLTLFSLPGSDRLGIGCTHAQYSSSGQDEWIQGTEKFMPVQAFSG